VTGLDFGALDVQITSMLTLELSVLLKFRLSRDVTFLTWRVATGVLKEFSAFIFTIKESLKNSLKTLRFRQTSELPTSDTRYISEYLVINNALVKTPILVVFFNILQLSQCFEL